MRSTWLGSRVPMTISPASCVSPTSTTADAMSPIASTSVASIPSSRRRSSARRSSGPGSMVGASPTTTGVTLVTTSLAS